MADVDTIDRLLVHNVWATRTLLEHCRALTPEQFTQTFEIGPGSLHDTLLHIVGAMRRWADRIGGRPVRPSVEDDTGTRTPDEIIVLLDEAASDLAGVIRRVADENRLDEKMNEDMRYWKGVQPFTRGAAVVHVATHGVHHRAQALNMLRQLGVERVGDLPEFDAISCELAETVSCG